MDGIWYTSSQPLFFDQKDMIGDIIGDMLRLLIEETDLKCQSS